MGVEIINHPLDRVIVIANGKGGVGKTSLSANLAAEAAEDGLDVLVVDLDPQGNLAEDLGWTGSEIDDEGEGLAAALMGQGELNPVPTGRDRLWAVPGGEHLRLAQRYLDIESAVTEDGTVEASTNNGMTFSALAEPLARIAEQYDLIVLDSPPGTAALAQAALGAARWLLVPARSDDSSRKGLRRIDVDFAAAQGAGGRAELLAVVLFGVNSTATAKRAAAVQNLTEDLDGGAPVLDTVVRASASADTARYLGLTAGELARAKAVMPPWHKMRNKKKLTVRLPLPDTPAVKMLGPDDVIRHIDGTGGNLDGLADDYDKLAEEVFELINAKEAQAAPAAEAVKA